MSKKKKHMAQAVDDTFKPLHSFNFTFVRNRPELFSLTASAAEHSKMSLVVIKVNGHYCRAVIATNFTHSFCGAGLVKSLKLMVNDDLKDPPAVTTSEGISIEFLGQALVQLELGPWHSNGFMPILIAYDCPGDMLIGQDLIDEISVTFPIKFEYHKNSVNVGGTRVSMLDPTASEEKFLSVRVVDPRNSEELGLETWKRGVREGIEMGGLVKRRVEVMKGYDGKEGKEEERKKEEEERKQDGRKNERKDEEQSEDGRKNEGKEEKESNNEQRRGSKSDTEKSGEEGGAEITNKEVEKD